MTKTMTKTETKTMTNPKTETNTMTRTKTRMKTMTTKNAVHSRSNNTHRFQRVSTEYWKDMSCTFGISRVHGCTQTREEQEGPIEIVLFAPDHSDQEPTHIHFFMTIEEARKCWHDIKHMVPMTIETVGFNEE